MPLIINDMFINVSNLSGLKRDTTKLHSQLQHKDLALEEVSNQCGALQRKVSDLTAECAQAKTEAGEAQVGGVINSIPW